MKVLKEKGITLIALVVTIIILLILAGVTISQIGGNNGLFSKVRQAVDKYKNASLDEELAIGEIERYLEGFNITEKEEGVLIDITRVKVTALQRTIKVEIEVTGEVSRVVYKLNTGEEWKQNEEDEKSLTYTFEELSIGSYSVKVRAYDKNGKYVEAESEIITIGETTTAQEKDVLSGRTYISGDGSIKTGNMINHGTVEETIGAGESYTSGEGYYEKIKITAEDNSQRKGTISYLKDRTKPSIIGKKVTGLKGELLEKYEWQILYIDDTNIYLIASDYIEVKDCPTTEPKDENGQAKEGHNVPLNTPAEYQGYFDSSLLNDYKGSEDIENIEDVTLRDKIKSLNSEFFNNNYESDVLTMKATAYMLDTNIWTKKFAGTNDKVYCVIGAPSIELLLNAYNVKYETNYKATVVVEEGNSTGYRNQGWYLTKIDGTIDSAFAIGTNSKASNMWIASPINQFNALSFVTYQGKVGGHFVNWGDAGFRPVILLNSNVELEEQQDGNFIIK